MYCKILRDLVYMNYQQEYSTSKVMSSREMTDRTGGSLTFSAEQLHQHRDDTHPGHSETFESWMDSFSSGK